MIVRSILTMLDQDGGLKHQLGRKLRCCLSMNCTVAKAVKHMQMLRCSALLVENDESRLVGILTERDIVTKIVAAGSFMPHTAFRFLLHWVLLLLASVGMTCAFFLCTLACFASRFGCVNLHHRTHYDASTHHHYDQLVH